MIYLDYAASTPIAPEVIQAMLKCMQDQDAFANPSSTHQYGQNAQALIHTAREQVADLINAKPTEIVFTSGATEAINTALKGVIARCTGECHIITSQIEHSAVLETCKHLGKQGVKITYLKPDSNGVIGPEQVSHALIPETKLVSLQSINNEVGAIQDIAAIGKLCLEHRVLFHIDAVQSVGKLPIDVQAQNIDLLSLSAHKFYGPKGIGVLYVRNAPEVKLTPLIHGGSHEQGRRAGTLATHQIVGLGVASELAKQHLSTEPERLAKLRDQLWQEIKAIVPGVKLNGDFASTAPGILNVVLPGVDRDKLMRQVACATSSACHSSNISASYVLLAMGVSVDAAKQSVRFSLGVKTTSAEIAEVALIIKACTKSVIAK